MILWPKQLDAIQHLSEGSIQSVELVPFPRNVRVTINSSNGQYKIVDINDDGECDEIFRGPV